MKPPLRRAWLIYLRTSAPDPTPRLALVTPDVYRYLLPGQPLINFIGEVAALYLIGTGGMILVHTVNPVAGRP